VDPDQDLINVMSQYPKGMTYCLAAGTFDIGDRSVKPKPGDVLQGAPVTVGPLGQIDAPTKIVTTASGGVVAATANAMVFTLRNLDLCCASGADGKNGRGINGNGYGPVVTVQFLRVHGNQQNGIAAVGGGSLFEDVEVDHNGSLLAVGRWGGIKNVDPLVEGKSPTVIRRAYVHDNIGNGVWWDCDARAGVLEDSRITGNTKIGVFLEISSFSSGPVVIQNNVVDGNNTDRVFGGAGIQVTSSKNAEITGNSVHGNGGADIAARNDSRAGSGHRICTSGFHLEAVEILSNSAGAISGCRLPGVTCKNNATG
jgi:hypothetical protein